MGVENRVVAEADDLKRAAKVSAGERIGFRYSDCDADDPVGWSPEMKLTFGDRCEGVGRSRYRSSESALIRATVARPTYRR